MLLCRAGIWGWGREAWVRGVFWEDWGTGAELGAQSFTYTGKGETSVLPCWGIMLSHYVSKVFPISKCSSYLIIQLNFAVHSFSAVGLGAGSDRF
jgi:hypothetical protein